MMMFCDCKPVKLSTYPSKGGLPYLGTTSAGKDTAGILLLFETPYFTFSIVHTYMTKLDVLCQKPVFLSFCLLFLHCHQYASKFELVLVGPNRIELPKYDFYKLQK